MFILLVMVRTLVKLPLNSSKKKIVFWPTGLLYFYTSRNVSKLSRIATLISSYKRRESIEV